MESAPHRILKQYWGFDEFRPLQLDIVQSVLDGQPTLALLPTGGGKSICFQVPALCMDGLCLVVSPLVALMKDQVMQLKKRGIKAVALYSGMSKREIDITLDNCIYGDIKFLYVSPERLKTELFLERASQMKFCLLAVDEAHCVSQWGYDFRPTYLEIAKFRETVPISKIIALTASATREVKFDILEKLKMEETRIFQKSFARANLSYSVFQIDNKEKKLLDILKKVPGTAVIYVRNRKRTREMAELLQRNGISADFYHAGLTPQERSKKQDAWIENKVRVIVSTNAFGMGIDKPDVRLVVHLDLPDSLEAYYQEAGRAGRDEKKAYAVILVSASDLLDLEQRAEQMAVTMEQLKRTYQALANHYKLAVGSGAFASFTFDEGKFIETYKLPATETFYSLQKLEDEGLIQLSDDFHQSSRVMFLVEPEEVYKFQVAHAALDRVVKSLLRLYGGELYSQYLPVDERDLAKMLKTNVQEVVRHLEFLHQANMIEYQQSSGKPHVTFLTPRQDINRLQLDEERIRWRRKVTLAKAAAMKAYATSTLKCRSRMIQHYFDETINQNCEVCDICLDRRKREKLLPLKEVLAFLADGPKAEEVLLVNFSKMKEHDLVASLRYLMDTGQVKLTAEEHFALN